MQTRLKAIRKHAGITQEEAADALGVSIGTYRNCEQGRVVMNGEQLIAAAMMFDTTVDHILMTDTDDCADIDPREELMSLFDVMNGSAKTALVIVARGLADQFPE